MQDLEIGFPALCGGKWALLATGWLCIQNDNACSLLQNIDSGIAGKEMQSVAVTMNEVLLRGCTLKNSKAVYGVVVYTGPESRIQKNAAYPPRKLGM